jgi:E3 ubiquitin-protein ligase HUWE1
LRSFDQADRAKFLQFVTGTSKVPLQGFGALEGMNGVQKFQIHRDDRSTDRLPSAHTWYVTFICRKMSWSLTFLFFAASIN